VLVCCIGRATRLVQFLVGLDKEYTATVRLGYATDTQDGTGKQITPLRTSKEVSLDELRRVLSEFTGPQLQTPPMFSAKKIGGERLYQAARAGREIEREPVRITVHSIAVIEGEQPVFMVNEDGTSDLSIETRCSSGTYVRTLAHDIGERLGVGAHLINLRRTRVGHFDLDAALTLDRVERSGRDDLRKSLVGTSEMLKHLPAILLNEERLVLVTNGRGFVLDRAEVESASRPGVSLRLCDQANELVAVGEYDAAANVVRPRVVMRIEEV